MPTSAEPVTAMGAEPTLFLDTSAALAYVTAASPHCEAVERRVEGEVLGLAGPAVFEFYSALTRMPGDRKMAAPDALAIARENFPCDRHLPPEVAGAVIEEFARVGVQGGAVYDGLIAATARHYGATLITCDRRAVSTYTRLGVDFELILGDR